MKFKSVIFDLDGTLVNSIEDLSDAMNTVLKNQGFPTHTYQAYKIMIGSGIKNLVGKALPATHANENTINASFEMMMEIYSSNCINKTKPYDGIIELLDYLKAKEIPLNVLSNKSDVLTKKITEAIFPNYFQTVLGLTSEETKKPNPVQAIAISEKLGIPSDKCIFIGDTEVDIQTAKNANMFAVGVLWGFREKEELLSNGAQFLLSKPLDLIEIL